MQINVNGHFYLSEIQASDLAAFVEYLAEKEIYDRTLRIPHPYTEADAQAWLAIVEKTTREQGRPVKWAIRDRDDRLIGGVGFDDFVLGKSHRAEIGYWLAKPYWGRGIMTAVVQKACAFAFAEFGLVKITAHVFADNLASARVLEKCGFELEGYLKKHYLKDGRLLDAKAYALFR
jgi:RimJ/RimL family protein N-acetyltransferase